MYGSGPDCITLSRQLSSTMPEAKNHLAMELLSGEIDLFQGKIELLSGENELFPGEKELLSGENELFRGENELFPGMKELLSGENELLSGENELFLGEIELLSGENELFPIINELSPGIKGSVNREFLHDGQAGTPSDKTKFQQYSICTDQRFSTTPCREGGLGNLSGQLAIKTAS